MKSPVEIFSSFSEEKKILVLHAISNYLYLKGVETGFLDSVPRLDEIEALVKDPGDFYSPYASDFIRSDGGSQWSFLCCLFSRTRGIKNRGERYIDVHSTLKSISYVCGEPEAAENILYSLMGVEV